MILTIVKRTCIKCCLLLFSIQAFTQGKLTLRQSVETALSNNLQVKQSDLQMQTAAVSLKQSKANLLPDLIANLGHGINQGRSIDPFTNSYINQQVNYANYSLSTNITLFNGLQLKNSVRQYALSYEAGKMELQQTKDNITLSVIQAYLQILTNEDQVLQSKNQAEVTRRQVERLDILNKAGAIAPAQFYDLKGQLANDELTLINNQNTLEDARLTLAQLMNVPYDKTLEVESLEADLFSKVYESTPDQIYGQALQQLAIVKAAELRKLSAQKEVQVAKGAFYPRVGFSGNLFTNYSSAAHKDVYMSTVQAPTGEYVEVSGNKLPVVSEQKVFNSQKINYADQFNNNYSTSVSVGIQIPILNAARARNQVSLAKIDLKNAEYISETTKIQLRQSIDQAYFNMTAAYERYKTLINQVNDFSESFKSAEIRFNAGASTQVDYLIAKNNLDRANTNLIIVKYDYILRTKILDYYQSKPLW